MTARIWSNASGTVVSFLPSDDNYVLWGAPSSFIYFLSFDETTNAELSYDIKTNKISYSLIGTSLTKNGGAVTIAADSLQTTAQKAAIATWNGLSPTLQSGTVDQFTTYVDSQVFNGQTVAQVTATINSTVVNITTANVAQINAQLGNIRTMLIAAATAIIGLREVLKIVGKLVIIIRDATFRFTKFLLGVFGLR